MNRLTDIPRKKYQGYVWFSDQEYPKVLRNESFAFESEHLNPFVIEALLFCEEDNTSVSVIHTGEYKISSVDLSKVEDGVSTEIKRYFSHRIEGVTKMRFVQIWGPTPDPHCAGMDVLTLQATVFKGFED